MNLTERICTLGIVPVVRLDRAEDAPGLAKVLCEGGLPCAEVTFRTEAAEEGIRLMKEVCPDLLIGAGTVLSIEQVDRAVRAGAEFIVSPGFNPEVVGYCVKQKIPVFPGCSSPSDIEQAIKFQLKTVKIFPAEAIGGLKMIRALAGPYGQMEFMPTGGIGKENIREYLSYDKILACGGTWMVPPDLIREGNFAKIRELTEEAVHAMLDFRLAHVGINCADETQAKKTAETFEQLFGFGAEENPSSIFSGSYVENLKTPYLGTKGHIAVGVSSVERGRAYLERKGAEFLEESAVYRKDGKMQAIYLKEEIGGFAVHLVRNPESLKK